MRGWDKSRCGVEYVRFVLYLFMCVALRLQHRHVTLPTQLVKIIPRNRLLGEHEWRSIGVQQVSVVWGGVVSSFSQYRRCTGPRPRACGGYVVCSSLVHDDDMTLVFVPTVTESRLGALCVPLTGATCDVVSPPAFLRG